MVTPKKKPEMVLEEITPEIAEKYLAMTKVQRRLRERKVQEYAEDMLTGNWRVTDAAVAFDKNGALIQGQHRLTACIRADKPFETWVVRGLDPSTQDVMDTGLKRSLGDALSMAGEVNTHQLAALLRTEWLRAKDPQLRERMHAPSHSALWAMFRAEPEKYREAVAQAGRIYQGTDGMATLSIWASVWVQLSALEDDQASEDMEDFLHLVKTGENIGPQHPVFVLRRVLTNMDALQFNQRRKYYGLIFKAWNAYRAGQKIDVLTFRTGGKTPEMIPAPK